MSDVNNAGFYEPWMPVLSMVWSAALILFGITVLVGILGFLLAMILGGVEMVRRKR